RVATVRSGDTQLAPVDSTNAMRNVEFDRALPAAAQFDGRTSEMPPQPPAAVSVFAKSGRVTASGQRPSGPLAPQNRSGFASSLPKSSGECHRRATIRYLQHFDCR